MKKASAVTAALIGIIFYVNYSCNNNSNKPDNAVAEGEKLAHVHCLTCHAFPGPALLDKKHGRRMCCQRWRS